MKAGFFEQDVTPDRPVYLAGYPGRKEPSQGVDDPLFLRIAAMEDDAGERFVLVTADLLKFPGDMTWRTKQWAEAELGLKSAALVVNLSHTHSAPGLYVQRCYPGWAVDDAYVCGIEQSIREGIAAALDDLQPTRVSYGLHQAHFGVNRRALVPDSGGRRRLGANPDGYYDPDLPVFAFHREDDLCAVLYSYACHATSKNRPLVSADWPGQVSQALKRELGDGVVTLFAQGAGGSVMSRKRLGTDEEGYAPYWAEVGRDIADFVRSDAMTDLDLQLNCDEKVFLLPYDMDRFPSRRELMEAADPRDTPFPDELRPANRSILRLWARDMIERVRTDSVPKGFPMHLTRVRLNDSLQIMALSGEVTAEVGRMIKSLFPQDGTLFLGYCSYTEAYIPTAAMLPEGGHEALCSIYFHERPAPFKAEIDEILKREAADWGGKVGKQ